MVGNYAEHGGHEEKNDTNIDEIDVFYNLPTTNAFKFTFKSIEKNHKGQYISGHVMFNQCR